MFSYLKSEQLITFDGKRWVAETVGTLEPIYDY